MNYDQLYIQLHSQQRRLMTENNRKNAAEIKELQLEIRRLRNAGRVSDKAIEVAPYAPWRGRCQGSCLDD